MSLLTFRELIDMVIVTFVLGFIFMDQLRRPRTPIDVLRRNAFDRTDFLFAVMITAPGILLHELAHKFTALFFGISATFQASYFGLSFGALLKIIGSPFILFAPGYVVITNGSVFQQMIIAFAGPFLNLLLFFVAWYVLEHQKRFTRMQASGWFLTKQINIFLFVFNMLPIPPLDGYKVFSNLIKTIF